MSWLDEKKGRLGFGFARLPMDGDDVDYAATSELVDAFLDRGLNYFDTSRFYANNKSEQAIKKCLAQRYPRDSFMLCDKLSMFYFDSQAEIVPLFESQLQACGVEYFDFYLMHGQSAEFFEKYKRCRAYETVLQLIDQGRVRHLGISFHDKAQVLETILDEYPMIEMVQIQFNYLDYEDDAVQSRMCYEICKERGVPTVVMEPLRGGSLVTLPDEAQRVLDSLGREGATNVEYALRYAANFENNALVLSGMNTIEQIDENARTLEDPKPMSEAELQTLGRMHAIFSGQGMVPCTGCKYCMVECPLEIQIPDIISCLNSKRVFKTENSEWYYIVYTLKGAKASDCVRCGRCEQACPQHLPVIDIMREAATLLELPNDAPPE